MEVDDEEISSLNTVYLYARKIYQRLRGSGWRPDVVIDEVNTVPFFTPKYVKEPVAMLIHQLCKDCWKYAVNPLAQPLGWRLEKAFHNIYTKAAREGKLGAVITVSQSTKQDLIELGYPEELIHIVHNGLDWDFYSDCTELADGKDELVAYVGRITPYKRLEDLLKAWKVVEQGTRDAALVIAGRPEPRYLERLARLAKKLNLRRAEFRANIPQQEKKKWLARAKILVYPSTREGWGQPVLEAAVCGTPAVAYDVSGLRYAVRHMETGILVKPGDISQLAEAIGMMLRDSGLRNKLSENAYIYAQSFSWDSTAEVIAKILSDLLTSPQNLGSVNSRKE